MLSTVYAAAVSQWEALWLNPDYDMALDKWHDYDNYGEEDDDE